MKYRVWFLCVLSLSFVNADLLPAAAEDSELEALKRRITELERQNQTILKALEDIKSRIAHEETAAAPAAVPRPTPTIPARKEDQAVVWQEITSAQSRIKFYGFLRLDLIMDDSRPDNPQSIFYVQSEDPRAGVKDYSNFTLYPRLTRFGATFSGPTVPPLGHSRLSGLLEMDFNNGGRESRPIPRIRHAWLKLSHGSFFVLGGQTWDLSSPLMPTPNSDTVMWNVGNLGDRRPQIQAVFEPKAGSGQWHFGTAIGLTGAVDGRDLDNDGFRDGEQSGKPNLQARLGYSWPLRPKGPNAGIGISAHRGWESTTKPIAGRRDFYSQSVGMDYAFPLHDLLSVRGEAWFGRNLSDIRGGIGQGINLATGGSIRSRGGWVEAGLKAHKLWTLAPGYTMDDPKDEDIPAGGRVRNRALYFANRLNLGGGLLIGADYLRWITDYKGLLRGTDNRINLFFQYSY